MKSGAEQFEEAFKEWGTARAAGVTAPRDVFFAGYMAGYEAAKQAALAQIDKAFDPRPACTTGD